MNLLINPDPSEKNNLFVKKFEEESVKLIPDKYKHFFSI